MCGAICGVSSWPVAIDSPFQVYIYGPIIFFPRNDDDDDDIYIYLEGTGAFLQSPPPDDASQSVEKRPNMASWILLPLLYIVY